MQKLDEIFRAEEDARRTLDEAHARAVTITAQGTADAKAAIDAAKRESEQRATVILDAALAKASADADSVTTAARAELQTALATARERVPDAVRSALEELVG